MQAGIVLALEDALGELFHEHRRLLRFLRQLLIALPSLASLAPQWLQWAHKHNKHRFKFDLHMYYDIDESETVLSPFKAAEYLLLFLSESMHGQPFEEIRLKPGWHGNNSKKMVQVWLWGKNMDVWMPEKVSNLVVQQDGEPDLHIMALGVTEPERKDDVPSNRHTAPYLWIECADVKPVRRLMQAAERALQQRHCEHNTSVDCSMPVQLLHKEEQRMLMLTAVEWPDLLLDPSARCQIERWLDLCLKQRTGRGACIFMLHGPPGTGKSTLVASLAHKLQRSLHYMNTFGRAVEHMLKENVEKSVFVMEECDKVLANDVDFYRERAATQAFAGATAMAAACSTGKRGRKRGRQEEEEDNGCGLAPERPLSRTDLTRQLQVLQQLMSGCTPHNLVLVFTTNDLARFRQLLQQCGIDDRAWLRPYRVDACIEVGLLPGAYVQQEWQRRLPEQEWGRLATETPPSVPLVHALAAMQSKDSDMLWQQHWMPPEEVCILNADPCKALVVHDDL